MKYYYIREKLSSMNEFFLCTLNPDKFGTVADWITVLFGGVTLYGLYVTLKSQNATQQMQADVTKMESARFKSEIPITFKSSGFGQGNNVSRHGSEMDGVGIGFRIDNISKETVNDIRFAVKDKYWNVQEPPEQYVTEMQPGDFRGILVIGDNPNRKMQSQCTIEITYQDIRGVRYKHSIGYDADARSYQAKPAVHLWDKKIERLPDDDLNNKLL